MLNVANNTDQVTGAKPGADHQVVGSVAAPTTGAVRRETDRGKAVRTRFRDPLGSGVEVWAPRKGDGYVRRYRLYTRLFIPAQRSPLTRALRVGAVGVAVMLILWATHLKLAMAGLA